MKLLALCLIVSSAVSIPSFIAQHRANECRFEAEKSSLLSSGTYVFQQLESFRFNFVIKAKGKCLDPPLVYERDQLAAVSIAGEIKTDADMIYLSGEIQNPPEKLMILVVPSTDECDFELQQGSVSFSLNGICPVGERLVINFEAGPDIPKSVAGLLLVDGIRDYVRYDYKARWKSLSMDKRNRVKAAYRQFREVYIKIKPFITGDVSQQQEAEGAARAACAHLNHLIKDPMQHVAFNTITLSGFNKKWKKNASRRTFRQMVIQSKESRLGECHISSSRSSLVFAGTYVFLGALEIQQLESLKFDFQFKAIDECKHRPTVSLRDTMVAKDVGTTTTQDEMIRIFGEIKSSDMGDELLLNIPSSNSCLYQLTQASLTLHIPKTVDEFCLIGNQVHVDWEVSQRLEPDILESMGPEMLDVADVDEAFKDLSRDEAWLVLHLWMRSGITHVLATKQRGVDSLKTSGRRVPNIVNSDMLTSVSSRLLQEIYHNAITSKQQRKPPVSI